MIIKKRQLVMATLILALSAAVFINWYYTRPVVESAGNDIDVTDITSTTGASLDAEGNLGDAEYVNSDSAASKEEYFANSELKRSEAHDKALDALEDVIEDSKSDDAAVKKASAQLDELTNAIKLEADIEALILAKTGLDSVVLINGKKCETVVENGDLDGTGVLKIKELVTAQTGFSVENITIIELSS